RRMHADPRDLMRIASSSSSSSFAGPEALFFVWSFLRHPHSIVSDLIHVYDNVDNVLPLPLSPSDPMLL
ncbi:hypothetical protein BaRGS_00014953, partial [Batillaria attramentaria]